MSKPNAVRGLGPRTPLLRAAPRLLLARLQDAQRLVPAAAAGDADAVHDLRVACRRLRVAVDLLGGSDLTGLEPQIKDLQDALGAVRDGHVQRPWVESTGLAPLLREADARAAAASAAMGAALQRFERTTAPAFEHAIEALAPPGRFGGKRMRHELRRRLKRLGRRLRKARGDAEPAQAHALRIAAKRVRYQAELLSPAFPEAAAALLDEIEGLQDALGDLHDADVRILVLQRFLDGAEEADVPGALTALALVLAERDALAANARREMKRWRKANPRAAIRAG